MISFLVPRRVSRPAPIPLIASATASVAASGFASPAATSVTPLVVLCLSFLIGRWDVGCLEGVDVDSIVPKVVVLVSSAPAALALPALHFSDFLYDLEFVAWRFDKGNYFLLVFLILNWYVTASTLLSEELRFSVLSFLVTLLKECKFKLIKVLQSAWQILL